MDTKFFPNVHGWMNLPVTHLDAAGMRGGLETSLEALGAKKVDLWYLHAPDRSVPLEDTLKAVNELYKEGKFERWGVSNYMSWEGTFSIPASFAVPLPHLQHHTNRSAVLTPTRSRRDL
jgi:aflatoxin B1 aldehyde reductase